MLSDRASPNCIKVRVIHSVAGLNEAFGGPSRTVPALCSALVPFTDWVGLTSQTFSGRTGRLILPEAAQVHVSLSRGVYLDGVRLAVGFPARHIRRFAGGAGPGIFHDHGVWQPFNHTVARVAHEMGAIRIVSPRGMLMKWSMARSVRRKALLWRMFQQRDLETVNAFVATSAEEAADIRHLGLRQPIAVIPNGVLMPAFTRAVSKEPRTAVFLSRIHPKKGLLNLVNAWSLLRPAGWRLTIAGPDEDGHRDRVIAEIERLGLGDAIQVRPEVPESEKHEFLARSQFAILPSESENFGMVVAEAMSVGIPVIASTGTPWSALSRLGIGWWVDNSPAQLAAAIDEAVSMPPGMLAEKGRAAKRFIEANYSWTAVGERTAELYRWILGGSHVAPSFVLQPASDNSR